MSKYLAYTECVLRDRATLLAALADMGYTEIEEGEALPLYGYHGDRRTETAELVVRRRHISSMSNDIGFKLTEAGYVPIVSEFDGRALGYRLEDGTRQTFVPALRTRYHMRVAQQLADRLRGTVTERYREGATLKMKIRF